LRRLVGFLVLAAGLAREQSQKSRYSQEQKEKKIIEMNRQHA
jgi:hypothetical protein